jgi:choline dehydrogenase-like flavoprotein
VQAGCGFYQLTQRDARRSSTAQAFLKPAEARPNLTVMTDAEVLRIVVEAGRAVGVEVTRDGAMQTIRTDGEVLLTAGAIGSPRLLMLSGIGPADHLRGLGLPVVHDLPGVGANLQDHLDVCVLAECTGRHSYDGTDRIDRTLLAGLQYLLTKTGPVAASLFETGGFWFADPDARSPDIQFHLGQGSGIETGIAKVQGWGVTLNSAYLRPRSRGTVRLASADPSAAPLIDPNYWDDPHDRAMSLRGLEMAREILRQPALRPFLRKEVAPGPGVTGAALLPYAHKVAKTDHHPVGTCRMGSDAGAVVAPDLRLNGIEGLRVCDASVMPALPSCNTNAPTIMLAEKAADLVLGRAPLRAVVPARQRGQALADVR